MGSTSSKPADAAARFGKETMQALDKNMGRLPQNTQNDIRKCMVQFCYLLEDTQRYAILTKRMLKLQLGAIESLKDMRNFDVRELSPEEQASACALLTDAKERLHRARDQHEELSSVCQGLIRRYIEQSKQLDNLCGDLRGYADEQNKCKWLCVAASVVAGCMFGCIALIAGVVSAPAIVAVGALPPAIIATGGVIGAIPSAVGVAAALTSEASLRTSQKEANDKVDNLRAMLEVEIFSSAPDQKELNDYEARVRQLIQKLEELDGASESNSNILGASQLYRDGQAEMPLREGQPGKKHAFAERVLDVDSTEPMLSPISGVMQCPIVSLHEAVQPLQSLVPEVVNSALFATWFVESNSPSGDDTWIRPAGSSLTEDEIGAMHLYTQDCMYGPLNGALRSENRDNIKPYFKFLRLLMAAINKLPVVESVVSRGIELDLSGTYTVGCKLMWWAFSSATINDTTVEGFMGRAGKRSLLSIHQVSGRDISRYSAFQGEEEIILTPGFYFKVTEVKGNGGDVTVYTLNELSLSPQFNLFP